MHFKIQYCLTSDDDETNQIITRRSRHGLYNGSRCTSRDLLAHPQPRQECMDAGDQSTIILEPNTLSTKNAVGSWLKLGDLVVSCFILLSLISLGSVDTPIIWFGFHKYVTIKVGSMEIDYYVHLCPREMKKAYGFGEIVVSFLDALKLYCSWYCIFQHLLLLKKKKKKHLSIHLLCIRIAFYF